MIRLQKNNLCIFFYKQGCSAEMTFRGRREKTELDNLEVKINPDTYGVGESFLIKRTV